MSLSERSWRVRGSVFIAQAIQIAQVRPRSPVHCNRE
jgi:hypothetical protein